MFQQHDLANTTKRNRFVFYTILWREMYATIATHLNTINIRLNEEGGGNFYIRI